MYDHISKVKDAEIASLWQTIHNQGKDYKVVIKENERLKQKNHGLDCQAAGMLKILNSYLLWI